VKLNTIISGLAVAAMALLPTMALAGTVAPGFATNTFAANDDGATGAINLGFSANYFGNTYTQTFISNNGYITFGSGQGTYTPTGLGAGYSGLPIIAAFFADVDTRGAGSGLTSYGTGIYAGHGAFGVTWPGVGYYSSRADKLNTFQIILTDRSDAGAGDFDIYFNYNQIQWETGNADGGINGLGGDSAAAGFNAGLPGDPAGTYFQLLGSLVNGAFLDGGPDSLVAGTNDGTAGQFLFQVRGGQIIVEPPPEGVPEPITLTVFGAGLVGAAALRRRNKKSA
jgi:hypothetical protein